MSMLPSVIAGSLGFALSGVTLYQIEKYNAVNASREFTVLGGANIAASSTALLGMLMWYYKQKKGDIKMEKGNENYERMMKAFWFMLMIGFILALVLAAMDVHMFVTDDSVEVRVEDGKLKGSYADTLFGLAIADIAALGCAIGILAYARYGTGQNKAPRGSIEF